MTELSLSEEALRELSSTTEGLFHDVSFVRIWMLVVSVSTLLVYLLAVDVLGDDNEVTYYYFIVAFIACLLIVFGFFFSFNLLDLELMGPLSEIEFF